MKDTELYQQILGIGAPWFVSKVDLALANGRIDVFVEHTKGQTFPCAECSRELPVYDHTERRTWRHLDTLQYQTLLHAETPRVDCPEHGVRQVALPWAKPRSRFTLMFERFVLTVLAHTSVSSAARLLGLSWDEVFAMMQREVGARKERLAAEPLRLIGVDEKSFKRGQSYVTIVYDLERGSAVWTGPERTKETLLGFYRSLDDSQRAGIEGVAMDMWTGFHSATCEALADGEEKIVLDPFHVMKQVNEGVDRVRRNENIRLMRAGDERLKGTRYVWLYAVESLRGKYIDTLAMLAQSELETVRAWKLKESIRKLWDASSEAAARRFHRLWDAAARASGIREMLKVAQCVSDHLDGIMAYHRHRITNAAAEGINSAVQVVKSRARGYRNIGNFQTAILFYCGEHPSPPAQTA